MDGWMDGWMDSLKIYKAKDKREMDVESKSSQ